MLRTTENKIYRQGIRDEKELADGFPSKAEDLFDYQGLVIGSVEAGYFTAGQQELIREFVDRRGGGLLVLGGRFWLGRRRLERIRARGFAAGLAAQRERTPFIAIRPPWSSPRPAPTASLPAWWMIR